MSGSANTEDNFSELPCSKVVYRALIWENWVDKQNGRVMPSAFIRRPKESGLSICLDVEISAYLKSRFTKPTFGAGSLHVGRVSDLGLRVIQDKVDHGEIREVPLPAENPAEAERLASLLARQARWVNED
jgi:hypothetical protein